MRYFACTVVTKSDSSDRARQDVDRILANFERADADSWALSKIRCDLNSGVFMKRKSGDPNYPYPYPTREEVESVLKGMKKEDLVGLFSGLLDHLYGYKEGCDSDTCVDPQKVETLFVNSVQAV